MSTVVTFSGGPFNGSQPLSSPALRAGYAKVYQRPRFVMELHRKMLSSAHSERRRERLAHVGTYRRVDDSGVWEWEPTSAYEGGE